jgi:5-methylcytosine-specific restriction endonuclease McrA
VSNTYIPPALRRLVYERASRSCEYCLIPETAVFAVHEIDHIIAQKHGGPTDADNLALSCTLCNKHKGSDLASLDPETGLIVPLYHPRRDHWTDHFQVHVGQVVPLTPTGRVTVRLLQLNHPDRVEERTLLIAAKLSRFPE